MRARELLIETFPYIPPGRALEHLSSENAERHLSAATHSISEIVSHAAFWQEWFCRRCEGAGEPMPNTAALGWPNPVPGTWPDIHDRFLIGLERAASLGDQDNRMDQPIAPPLEFPPLAHYTVRDALVHIANHNAHHLGQVIMLRQLMGLWPPPSGSWTW